MSAPLVWILIPILIGGFTLVLLGERVIALTGGVVCASLAAIALIVPIDEALRFGPLSIKISSSASFLGRSLVLPPTEAPLLAVIFGLCALWFFGAEAAGVARQLIPLGLMICGFLVASLAVQPFLFASLLVEMSVLVAVPMLSPGEQRPGRGVIRFLVYQTLGMPFILLAGWLLAGVETSPGDLSLTIQATVMLGLGFAFLLAVFPLYDWIPQLMDQNHPYVAGFVLWLLPSIVVVFGMSFLDRYAWLRTSPNVITGLRGMGLLMLVTGGLWSAFARHLGRLMAYASITETGFLLISMSLAGASGVNLTFAFLVPRGLSLALWALALAVIGKSAASLSFPSVQGRARMYPWACAALALAGLSAAGFPLLAGFPPRLALWQALAHDTIAGAIWFLVGLIGLMIGAVRQLAVVVVNKEGDRWAPTENIIQRGMLGLGILGLVLLGMFPQLPAFVVGRLPLMFEHLSR